ncbi:AEC family transporter [Pantoea sp. B65]|uniref:AEC family transporter n=1 Tax=Pantoea sp. B65 TaxID=2813359 RepID=UPI0039B4B7E2
MSVIANLTEQLSHQIYLSVPLFILIITGYGLSKFARWPETVTEALNRFCFNVALPCMLFKVMSEFYKNPPVDTRLLFAFFGSCLLVYALGRIIAARVLALDGVCGSVFALGGVFSNNVMLGIPVATILLGQQSLPAVALVLVFNGLILWTLVTISVEWARTGNFSLPGIGRTLISVLRNPIIIGIMLGFAWSALHQPLPYIISSPVNMLAQIAAPLSLVTLGMSLAGYKISEGLRESYAICILKLIVQPLVIWLLAWSINLPLNESKVVVLLGSMAVGVNVYLMSQKFRVLQGASATSLLFSTLLSAITTPVFMMLMTMYY